MGSDKHNGPPLSATTKRLAKLRVGSSVRFDGRFHKSITKRANRLGIKIRTRRVFIGKDSGMVEVWRVE